MNFNSLKYLLYKHIDKILNELGNISRAIFESEIFSIEATMKKIITTSSKTFSI